jgi:hypothetical protein
VDEDGNIINVRNKEKEKDCIRSTYKSDIMSQMRKMQENGGGEYCNRGTFSEFPKLTDITITKGVNAKILPDRPSLGVGTPSCIVSRAGPYICAGTLKKDSELQVKSEKLAPSQQSSSLDAIKVADNELRQSFQAPSCNNIVYSPAAFISANSSIRNLELPDIAKNKDTIGLGGANGALLRQMFTIPKDSSTPYNPIRYHCTGSTLGGSGNWDCTLRGVPTPEEVDIYNLPGVKQACKLNPSVECSNKVFGANYQGGGEKIYPTCSDYSPTSNTNYNNFSEAFVKIISAAGSRYNVPAAVLLAYMQGIGNLQKYNYYWSDFGSQSLYDSSAYWYGTMDQCDDINTAAQGPFDWLLVWFNWTLKEAKDQDGVTAEEALNEISSGRGTTASRCNFLDAAYIAAANLGNGLTTECGDWDWALAQARLNAMTYGFNPVGDFADAPTFNPGSDPEKVFDACKY